MREDARIRALIGEGDGKVGRKEKESGGAKRAGRLWGGKDSNGNMNVEQGVKNEGNPNRKSILAVRKEKCGDNKG